MIHVGEYHEYVKGDTLSTTGYVQCIRRISWFMSAISWVHWEMFSTSEGYHEYIREISWFMKESSLMKAISLIWKTPNVLNLPHFTHDIPHIKHSICHMNPDIFLWTEHPNALMIFSTWTMVSPRWAMISLWCNEHRPVYSSYPQMCSWYPSKILIQDNNIKMFKHSNRGPTGVSGTIWKSVWHPQLTETKGNANLKIQDNANLWWETKWKTNLYMAKHNKWVTDPYPGPNPSEGSCDILQMNHETPTRLYHGVNAFTRVNLQHNWTNLSRLRICTRVNRGV